jgi:hypothetical protein
MPIRVKCACGRSLVIKETLAGKRVKCPACAHVLTVPLPRIDDDEEALNVLLTESSPAKREDRIEAPPPRPSLEPPSLPRRPPDEPPVPKKPTWAKVKQPKRERRGEERREPPRRVVFEEGWFGSVSAGALGGILMMVIAVVWFVVGYAAGRIFFYPPVLFVVGFIAMVRGLSGND